jgi:cytochrome c556
MKNRTAIAMALAALGLATAGAAIAASTDDLIATRQAEMKTNMKAMKVLVSIIKGETPYDQALVQDAAKSIQDTKAGSQAKGAWDASTQSGGTVKTGAKPEIWSDAAGFAEAWKSFDTAAAGLAAVTDQASLKAAFPALGASCKGCHEKFRAAE